MREGWDTCRTSHGLSRALQRLLPHGAECVYEPESEGEREYVCVVVAEGGDPTPPPEDCASLTGWRGRWGHCNKANTHTHTHAPISLWLLCPRFSRSFPPPHFHLSKTCTQPPSFADLLSFLLPRVASESVCQALALSPLLPFISHPSLPFCPYPFLSHCMVILTCSH